MNMEKILFILGSQSPRRKQMIDWLGIPYIHFPADIQEESHHTDPVEFVKDITIQKSNYIRGKFDQRDRSLILTCDTIVVTQDEILGKPSSREEAKKVLWDLRGSKHQVITGVCLNYLNKRKINQHYFSVGTDVFFNSFSESILETYLNTGDFQDKAGSYGLQGPGMVLVDKIEGSYSNVIGLPLDKLIEQLHLITGCDKLLKEVFCDS